MGKQKEKVLFYDKDGNKLFYEIGEENHIFRDGITARFYDIGDNKVLKYFPYIQDEEYRFISDVEAIEKLAGLGLRSVYKIYDILYRSSGGRKRLIPENYVKGITTLKYETGDSFIIDSMDYLLDSVDGLYESNEEMSEAGIKTYDLHDENLVIATCGLILIDADGFYLSRGDISNENRERLSEALFNLLRKLAKRHNFDIDEGELRKIFNLENDSVKIRKKLQVYGSPREYFASISRKN